MRLTVLCPHFAPDVAPTGEVMTSIAIELARRGHRLHVVTALPWYQDHAIVPGWDGRLVRHEDTEWGRITRIHPFPTDKRNIPARALAFGGFTALAAVEATIARQRPDAVLAMSPPLSLGLAGWAVARARRVPFVFNIQDVFPDVAIELGLLTGRRVIAGARALERLTYRLSDAVTVLSDELADNVRAKVVQGASGAAARQRAAKVRVIPNFVDTERIRPAERENRYRAEHGLTGKRVVLYAGNVGLSQSLDLVIDAAIALATEPDVVFVINGGGSAKPDLLRRAAGLDNVRFVDMQPKERLPEVLAAGDIHVVPLKRGLAWSSVPSKLYSILAAGRPVVASVDAGTEVARTIEQAGAGLSVPPEDAEAFTKALRRLLDAPDDARAMGERGRAFVEGWASPAAVAEAYERLFLDVNAELNIRNLAGVMSGGRVGPSTVSDAMGKASSAKKVARAARAGGASSKKRPRLAFPLAIFAVVVLGALVVVYARVDHTNTANADVKPSYTASDHWHAAYGVYVCDKFLAPVTDVDPTKDELGIHTHGDGLIHIHPFKASSSGENARMKLWGKQVGMEFYSDGWKMPDGTEYRNGSAKCGDQPAKTAIYKWKADDPSAGAEVFESNYGDINFTEDRDIYTFAVLPQDWPADKLPPQPESVSGLANPTAAEGGSSTGTGADTSGLDLSGLSGQSSGADTGTPSAPTP